MDNKEYMFFVTATREKFNNLFKDKDLQEWTREEFRKMKSNRDDYIIIQIQWKTLSVEQEYPFTLSIVDLWTNRKIFPVKINRIEKTIHFCFNRMYQKEVKNIFNQNGVSIEMFEKRQFGLP